MDIFADRFCSIGDHVGHDISCSSYDDQNISIECITCNEVLGSIEPEPDEVIIPNENIVIKNTENDISLESNEAFKELTKKLLKPKYKPSPDSIIDRTYMYTDTNGNIHNIRYIIRLTLATGRSHKLYNHPILLLEIPEHIEVCQIGEIIKQCNIERGDYNLPACVYATNDHVITFLAIHPRSGFKWVTCHYDFGIEFPYIYFDHFEPDVKRKLNPILITRHLNKALSIIHEISVLTLVN